MTTTTQSTVFTFAPVEAPVRCEVGEGLGKARILSADVKATKVTEEFLAAEAPYWLAYLVHVVYCPACLSYEQSRGRMK